MTDGEALKLKPGDVVEVQIRNGPEIGCWVKVKVRWAADWRGRTGVRVSVYPYDRTPKTPKGRERSFSSYRPKQVRLPPADIDPLPAQVYADFLEENGFPEAASALRTAFPLPPVEPGTPQRR